MPYRKRREPRVPAAESLSLYDEVIQQIQPDVSQLDEWFTRYARQHRNRIAFDIGYAQDYLKNGAKVLEIGSVPLLLTGALARMEFAITGADLAPERFQAGIDRLGLSVVKCNIETEKLPFPDEAFDAVIFNEVFEHLRINPVFTLQEVHRVTRPGGRLLLSTPNLKSLRGIIHYVFRNKAYSCCANMYNEYQKLETIGHMGHVREYTAREIEEFLEQIGFGVDEVVFRGPYHTRIEKAAAMVFAQLGPFMSIVAKKYTV